MHRSLGGGESMRLIDDAGRLFLRLWSVRIALGWGALCGLLLVWPAFQDVLSIWWFALGGVLISVAIAFARVTKQPGLDQ